MGGFSIWHWLIVLLVVLVLFGRGRVSEIMGDFGKGIKSFKQGMADENDTRKDDAPAPQIPASGSEPAASANETAKTEQK